ncbi:MAG: peptide chain release factor N(5)-glutamine methyltransferase [Phycisphaerales bacterium]|nr:peptide chain release factor N(5)-glutamine methyltransferase [Phycisphaerales bacterium]
MAAPWTTRTLLAWMNEAFERKDLDQPRFMAEVLMAHALGCERLRLYTDPDRPASDEERSRLRGLVTRALAQEPVQYLTAEAWFFGMPFHVDRRVLIPRPSTATIVERVLAYAKAEPGFGPGEHTLLVDVCTGSGCIAAAILKLLPGARALCTDVSTEALDVARKNLARHAVGARADFAEGDLLEPVRSYPGLGAGAGAGAHFIVSNPPYIPDDEWPAVASNVKDHEPTLALRAGPDGMRFVAPLIEGAPALLRERGMLLIELASSRAEQALALAQAHPLLDDAQVLREVDGLARVLSARRRRA